MLIVLGAVLFGACIAVIVIVWMRRCNTVAKSQQAERPVSPVYGQPSHVGEYASYTGERLSGADGRAYAGAKIVAGVEYSSARITPAEQQYTTGVYATRDSEYSQLELKPASLDRVESLEPTDTPSIPYNEFDPNNVRFGAFQNDRKTDLSMMLQLHSVNWIKSVYT